MYSTSDSRITGWDCLLLSTVIVAVTSSVLNAKDPVFRTIPTKPLFAGPSKPPQHGLWDIFGSFNHHAELLHDARSQNNFSSLDFLERAKLRSEAATAKTTVCRTYTPVFEFENSVGLITRMQLTPSRPTPVLAPATGPTIDLMSKEGKARQTRWENTRLGLYELCEAPASVPSTGLNQQLGIPFLNNPKSTISDLDPFGLLQSSSKTPAKQKAKAAHHHSKHDASRTSSGGLQNRTSAGTSGTSERPNQGHGRDKDVGYSRGTGSNADHHGGSGSSGPRGTEFKGMDIGTDRKGGGSWGNRDTGQKGYDRGGKSESGNKSERGEKPDAGNKNDSGKGRDQSSRKDLT